MNDICMRSFMERFNRDKQELNKRFDDINRKLENIDKKFEVFDQKVEFINDRCGKIEEAFNRFDDFCGKLEDVNIYLSTIETKLNQYKTLTMQGRKVQNGEIYVLKIKLQKIKPIVNWENNEELIIKVKEIENKFFELEQSLQGGIM
ncbi:MAG: hypothetical protein N2489_08480 [Clostridia bacterium]|nr:hypothetical protein [Clostridia bacterium]